MTRTLLLTSAMGIGAIANGCTGTLDDGRLYLLADTEARTAGYGWEVDHVGLPATSLPLGVDAWSTVRITGPRATRAPETGDLAAIEIVGSSGEIRLHNNGAVRPDLVVLRGDADAVADLLLQVHADVERHADGSVDLLASDIFAQLSQAAAPAGRLDVHTVPLQEEGAVGLSGAAAVPPTLQWIPAAAAERLADYVGVYRDNDRTLVLDAAGVFHDCDGSGMGRTGTFRLENSGLLLAGDDGTSAVLQIDDQVLVTRNGEQLHFDNGEDAP